MSIIKDASIKTIATITSLIKVLEQKDLNGIEKREELYDNLKIIMGEDVFLQNKEIINYVLETVIYLSKTHKIAGINQETFSYCCR